MYGYKRIRGPNPQAYAILKALQSESFTHHLRLSSLFHCHLPIATVMHSGLRISLWNIASVGPREVFKCTVLYMHIQYSPAAFHVLECTRTLVFPSTEN